MNENGYDNNQQYDNTPKIPLDLSNGLMSHLPEEMKDRIEDALAEAEQKAGNPYERVEPNILKTDMNPKIAIAALLIGFGGALVFAKIDPIIAVLCVGIMLLVFGIGIVTDKNFSFQRNAMSTLVLFIGLAVVLITGYLLLAKNNPSLPKLEGKLVLIVGGGGFAAVGALILILSEITYHYMKRVCTEQVQAVCVYHKERREYKKGRTYIRRAPVYEFQYWGNTRCVAEDFGAPHLPAVGDRCILFINPNNLKEFYRLGANSRVAIWIFCLIFVLCGALMAFMG